VSPKGAIRTTIGGRELSISNLDKVRSPANGFTKGQVIDYYVRIAEVMLPHIADRPLTLKRYPNGVDHTYFFEKHVPTHAPEWIGHIRVPSTSDGESVDYSDVSDVAGLAWAANLASIELHVPLWHVGRRRKLPAPPDHMVFDLDPGEGTSIVECCEVAILIEEILCDRSMQSSPKTSGSKGLQLYVPLGSKPTWAGLREEALGIALQLEKDHPELIVSNMRKNLRRGKVLIDWSQNHPAKTTVAAYSLRGRPEPTVSTPVTWDEVRHCHDRREASLLSFTAGEVLERVDDLGDLFSAL
jgi:bifunctional non-homologous end joining protein LigD